MNNSNVIYPYRQNIGIMKKFFSKPIVLLLAVANCLLIVAGIAVGFIMDGGSVNLTSFIIPAVNALAFFLFYINAKSDKPIVSFYSSILLLKIISIITIVVESIALALFAFSTVILFATPIVTTMLPGNLIMLFSISLPTLIVSLFQSIAMLILLGSFKKSTTSVYLYKKGAIFTAVTTTILFIVSAICTYATIVYLPDIITQLNSSIYDMLASLSQQVYSDIPQTDAIMQTTTLNSTVTSIIQLIIYILTIIFALSYHKYISKLSNTYNNSTPIKTVQPVVNAQPEQPIASNGVQSIKQPVNFNPQPVFKNENQAPPQNNAPTNHNQVPSQNQNPYVALWDTPQTKTVCPKCGFECPNGTQFCGNCGAKIK